MILVGVPPTDDLRHAPELAALAALEAVLVVAEQALRATHAELRAETCDPGELTVIAADAAAVIAASRQVVEAIDRYRVHFITLDCEPF